MLEELENKLRDLSHSEHHIAIIKEFSNNLGKTKDRIAVFNATDAILRKAISRAQASMLGFNLPEDNFILLQGDLISTESAYFFGERITGEPKYVVLNSSCDLVPEHRKTACLLPVRELRKGSPDVNKQLNLLLTFSRRDSMYLPKLPEDHEDVVANAVDFDGIHQIRSSDLLLCRRIASLSLVGWRIFASFARVVLARSGEREVSMREAVEATQHRVE